MGAISDENAQRSTLNAQRPTRKAELSVQHRALSVRRLYRQLAATLSADGLVMAEAALPHEARPRPREQKPAALDRQCLYEFRSLQSAEKNRDRTKQLVVKRQPFHYGLDGR